MQELNRRVSARAKCPAVMRQEPVHKPGSILEGLGLRWSSFYASDRLTEEEITEIEKEYAMDRIDKKINDTMEEIADLQAAIQRCQRLLSHAYYHRDLVLQLPFTYTVYWERTKYRGSPVYYHIGVYCTPNIPNGEKYRYATKCKRFKGKDRKAAKEYAAILCKLYNCGFHNVANGS